MFKHSLILAAVLIPAFFAPAYSQQCAPPAIVVNSNKNNLFSPEQEMVLGELVLQTFAREFPQVRDPELQKFIDELGGRIVKHLPETGLRFTFHIIDYPEANAFNIPGGHVFLSRKLIALSASEDELAGVIGHELGHATVHHSALDISTRMRKILNISALGDRKDVIEKFNLLIENARTKRVPAPPGHEDVQQLEADRIGLFAMVAAGYDPAAQFTLFDRLTESDGKTGGWFGKIFGTSKPAQKRLREIQDATDKLPAECREGRKAMMAEDYLQFQADVVMYREKARKEELPGLIWKKELKNKLRSDIDHLTFSRDGKLLLAQDDFGVSIVDHESKKVLFQIPVEDVKEASFTPDGRHVVLTTENLRFERWDVATRRPLEAREVVVRDDCLEYKLSPDGNYLACAALGDVKYGLLNGTGKIIETKTGKKVWEKTDLYRFSFFELVAWLTNVGGRQRDASFFRIDFAPDGRFVMFSRSDMYRYRFVGYDGYEKSEDTAVVIEFPSLKPVSVDGIIKKIAAGPYVFLDSERILGKPGDADSAGIFSFPSGKRLRQFTFGGRHVFRTGNPDYVIVKPLIQSRLGIFDIKRGTLLSGLNKEDAAIYGNLIAFEAASGEIVIRESKYNENEKAFDGKDIATIEVPPNLIGNLRAVDVSDNFNWLALSSTTKGGLWNVATGERKVLVRGFRGALAGDDGGAVGHFPKLREEAQTIALLNPTNGDVTPIREVAEKGSTQYGRFVLTRMSRNPKPEKDDKKPRAAGVEEYEDNSDLLKDVRFSLKDIVLNEVIWTREFEDIAPRYSFDQYSGRLILYWGFRSEGAKSLIRADPSLQPKIDAMGNKEGDVLLEVIDAFSKKTIGVLPVETGKASFNVFRGLSENDWVALYDTQGRVLVYSLKEGALRHRFFGGHAAINPGKNLIAVENFPGEINLYDLDSGESRTKLVFNGKAAFVRFNLAGNKLFVLSDAQLGYAFDLSKIPAPKPVQ